MPLDVLFPVVPYFGLSGPTAGVSVLKAAAARQGFSAQVRYFNFSFAERVGLDLYEHLSTFQYISPLAGEWIFARAAFGDRVPGEREAAAWLLADWERNQAGPPAREDATRQFVEGDLIPRITDAVALCRDLLDEWVDALRSAAPRVVGFTTLFGQTAPSLALSHRLK